MPSESTDRRLSDPVRLDAVDATALLDAPADDGLDRMTRLVQRVLRVPVALVSIVDDRRQWFASQQGLAEPWCSLRQTPLSHSFCKHVVASEERLVVEDAREDARVRDNLAIDDLGVIGYLGVPLRTPHGEVIGSLCAIDTHARAWTDADIEMLDALADEVMEQIALRFRLHDETERAWAALSRGGALFRTLLAAVDTPVAVVRADDIVVTANRAFDEHIGRPSVGAALPALLGVADLGAAEGLTLTAVPEAEGLRLVRLGG